ncbi:FAD-dependent oxidoreductase (plasmid) [Acaryochloris sp. 'Moss Beach']|uniref:NAD(P)/FAD-dependent oxidoreductase n=1 Tax=Acaryochloris TaxID=155977 RepID=UPI001BAE575E|nr:MULTISPECIES: FAD/NAD(P)-binding oxidoreductase [Acaryochloris]QUY45931.1 FAD-dependent oxidoreductase [Acaryochloris marina S15]UJB72532.1 FAD-dependent oxidoreductase [Acaryochloris sp. 'Moss Beach']
MPKSYQLVVIGAGPGGLCAATTAAQLGMDVVVLDEQSSPGGQIYRAITRTPADRSALLGADYQRGASLVEAFKTSGAQYWPQTTVWSLNAQHQIGILRQGQASIIQAERVIVASGAMERPVPFPGWTLPGVMNVGAAQILLKTSGVVPASGMVIAGTGPLPLLVAWQYLRAGVSVKAILECSPTNNLWRAAPRLPQALRAGDYIARGLKYTVDLLKGGVPIYYGVSRLQAQGNDQVEAVNFGWERFGIARQKTLSTNHLLVHFGVIPRTNLTRSAGCHHVWDRGQQCWCPQVDEWGNTNVPGLAVVGDNAGIGGARSAEHSGRLAALEAARSVHLISRQQRDSQGQDDQNWMRKDLRVRPFLETLYRLPDSLLVPSDDDTIVCRCEEISAGAIRRAVHEGHSDPNQVKFFLRCGMGPCQGRQCASVVAHMVAAENKRPVSDYPPFRVRPPIRPLSIAQLADLGGAEE